MLTNRTCSQWKWKMVAKRPNGPMFIYMYKRSELFYIDIKLPGKDFQYVVKNRPELCTQGPSRHHLCTVYSVESCTK